MLLGFDHGLKRKIAFRVTWKPVSDALRTHGYMTDLVQTEVISYSMKMAVGKRAREMRTYPRSLTGRTASSHARFRIGTLIFL